MRLGYKNVGLFQSILGKVIITMQAETTCGLHRGRDEKVQRSLCLTEKMAFLKILAFAGAAAEGDLLPGKAIFCNSH
jgi:hypothetical protein